MKIDIYRPVHDNSASDNEFFRVEATAVVDNENWYTVIVLSEVAKWIQTQDTRDWYCHIISGFELAMFDIHEELFSVLRLKFNG